MRQVMRQGTYLNIMLTVNAVLLTVLIWTQVADQPLLSVAAEAQSHRDAPLNAGAQRQKIIELLTESKRDADRTRKLLESGNLRVEVTNLSEIRIDSTRSND